MDAADIVDAAEWHRFEELFLPDAVLDSTGVHAPEVFVGIVTRDDDNLPEGRRTL